MKENAALNYEKVYRVLISEIASYITDHNLKSMILGISGGIDSTVVAALCHEVYRLTGIPLVGRSLPIVNKDYEISAATSVGIAFCPNDFKEIALSNVLDSITNTLLSNEDSGMDKLSHKFLVSRGNIMARSRMICLYNIASMTGGLVMDTDNLTEHYLGFFTIHGDVGDFNPTSCLWKTEVYGLAEWLINKYTNEGDLGKAAAITISMGLTPTDGNAISESDLEQIGGDSYEEVDNCLKFIVLGQGDKESLRPEVLKKITNRYLASGFKRKGMPVRIDRSYII